MDKNFEWISREICNEYIERAQKITGNGGLDTGAWRSLRRELQERCNLTELEAGNILRNRNVSDYLMKYGILSGEIPMTEAMRKRLEKQKKGQKDDLMAAKEKIADLESLLKTDHLSDYAIEEKD